VSKYKPVDEMTLEEFQQFDIFWMGYRLGLDTGMEISIKEFKKQVRELENDLEARVKEQNK
jgi:hypothetical protein